MVQNAVVPRMITPPEQHQYPVAIRLKLFQRLHSQLQATGYKHVCISQHLYFPTSLLFLQKSICLTPFLQKIQ